MARMFGTDGVRGVANTELTPELAMALGKAGAYVLGREYKRPLILIGRDTRISGCMLEDALCAGILSMGGDVIKVGVIPTPGIAFLVRKLNAAAGVVISASHNPFEYNGIKFFRGDGYKLDDAIEDEIEKYVKEGVPSEAGRSGADLGRIIEPEESPVALYRKFVKSTFDGDLKGIKLVLDCANGASYVAAEDVFTELGADVKVIADKPDGININDKCGSTHPEALGEAVLREHADMGLAFDGDADRLIAVDETGNAVDGDRVISVCARLMEDEGRLANDSVTVTVMSNIGFHKRAEELGIKVEVTAVGDRYVLENMKKTGCRIGGEQSGHMIFLDYSTTGDGMIAALQLLKAYKRYGKKLSELAEEMTVYPQVLINAHVKNENKHNYMENADVKAAIEEVEKKMAGEGRVLIRPSGTEPLVRVMLEGSDTEKIRPLARDLADLIESKLS
ncbi:MAG: phosphoglucosamine mutase [Anaerovoracaceae bacterium]|nr:phosphoglucosamine mutase [Bacillota bacterium]MDD7733931.1 phosphoglucosamine mutase [Bacillota bacterium]MDY5907126.1 phosphoglucosamine mutase [Anaerovoracaceae bacterium]